MIDEVKLRVISNGRYANKEVNGTAKFLSMRQLIFFFDQDYG
jgi:hypothetical protein